MDIMERIKMLLSTQRFKQPNYPTKIDFTRYNFTDDEKERFREFLVLNGLNLNEIQKELEEYRVKIVTLQEKISSLKNCLLTNKEIEKFKKELIDSIESIGKTNNSDKEKEK